MPGAGYRKMEKSKIICQRTVVLGNNLFTVFFSFPIKIRLCALMTLPVILGIQLDHDFLDEMTGMGIEEGNPHLLCLLCVTHRAA